MARRSPLLRIERDERLIALIRGGHDRAFEVLFDRYQSRLLAFCRSMLKSQQDAEDVLQEVFTSAHKAIVADDRKINVRPWIYRIARNRCLNHLRRPVPEGQDTMDIHPHLNGTSTAERVQKREELRQLLDDVETLPETQRSALLLREVEQLSYDEIAEAMETTIPAVKSLLVRARVALAESSEARALTCEEVRLTLAEAAEGLRKASGPVRTHVKNCDGCTAFRKQLRNDHRSLAAVAPIGLIAMLKHGAIAKALSGAGSGGAVAGAGGAVGAGSAAAGGITIVGGAVGTKAAVGMATAALLTAGAVEVRERVVHQPDPAPAALVSAEPIAAAVAPQQSAPAPSPRQEPAFKAEIADKPVRPEPAVKAEQAGPPPAEPLPAPVPEPAPVPVEPIPAEPAPGPEPAEPPPAPPEEPVAAIEQEPVESVSTPSAPPEVGEPAPPEPQSPPPPPPSSP